MTQDLAPRLDTNALIAAAIERQAPLEYLERLLALAKDVRREQAREAWYSAMARFNAVVPDIKKTKTAVVKMKDRNGSPAGEYRYHYAPLEEVLGAVRKPMAEQGLCITFRLQCDDTQVIATCLVSHEAGHVEETVWGAPVDDTARMNPTQQVASATTYAKRYALLGALGLAPEDDDDGQQGHGRPEDDRVAPAADPFDGTRGGRPQVDPELLKAQRPPQRSAQDMGKVTPRPKPPTTAVPKAAEVPVVKVSDLPPVREFGDDDGRPTWRGVLLGHTRNASGRNAGSFTWTFKGQDGQLFITENGKLGGDLALKYAKKVLEVLWEPASYDPKARELVDFKVIQAVA